MRTAAAAKMLGPNGWEKLGKGELMLVYNTVKGHSRIIFFAEASTARVYNAADINAWLFKGMKNEKIQEKSINVGHTGAERWSVLHGARSATAKPAVEWQRQGRGGRPCVRLRSSKAPNCSRTSCS